jgi:hypothetical protein
MAETTAYIGAQDFRIGKVFGQTFSIFARNALSFSLVACLLWIPVELFSYWSEQTSDDDMGFIALGGLFAAITIIFPLAIAILVHATFQTMRGQPYSLAASIRHGFKRFPQLVGVSCLMMLAGIFGLMLFVIPGLILVTMWYVAPPVCVVEKLGPIESLNRSMALTKGYRWLIFAIFFILIFFMGAIEGGIEATFAYIGRPEIKLIVLIFWGGISQAFGAVLNVVMYHDLRVAKEGLDTERIAAVFK